MVLPMARTRLGRVTTTSILRTQANSYSYSTRSSSSNWTEYKYKYTAIASVAISTPGIWWLINDNTWNKDDVPRLESPPAEHLPDFSEDQVTRIISQEAYSFPVRNVPGMDRYDGTQLASNSPCEDRFVHGNLPSPWKDGGQWMAWAVFDGHAGWQTADLLERQLLPFVRRSLGQIKPPPTSEESVELVRRAIIKGFVDLDDSIIKTALDTSQSKEPLQEKVKKLAPAYAGSCALLSMYDSVTSTLHVACTGDSRAVLGQKGPDGKWEAMPLSIDQTGNNEEEVARLHEEHPGEEGTMAKGGRVLGLMVSRAFGDSRWKWPLDFQQDVKRRFYGPATLTPRYNFRTPPYLTAEPVVTATNIDPSKPSFLIMATDGMWDTLSNQQAVDLVGKWLEKSRVAAVASKPEPAEPTYYPFDFGHFWKGTSWEFAEERTTIQDDNAAVHLVRNSLGGNHQELIAGRLAFSPPFSRNVRDDITVQVAFFNVPGLGNK